MVVKIKDLLKKQKASVILSNLGLRTPLNKIPSLADLFL